MAAPTFTPTASTQSCGILGGDGTPGGGGGVGNGGGGVTVNITPADERHRMIIAQTGLTTGSIEEVFHGGITSTGTVTLLHDTTGAYASYASTTLSQAQAGWRSTAAVTALDLLPDIQFTMKTGPVVTEVAYNLGFQATPFANSSADHPTRMVTFRYNNDVAAGNTRTDLNWYAYAAMDVVGPEAAPGEYTDVDTGVPVEANTRYTMRIQVLGAVGTGADVLFFINGNFVARIATSTFPASDAILFLQAYGQNGQTGTSRSFRHRKTEMLHL